MLLCTQIEEPFEGLSHKCCRDIVLKVVEAHAHQFLLDKLQQTLEEKPPLSHNEAYYAFVLSLSGLDQF